MGRKHPDVRSTYHYSRSFKKPYFQWEGFPQWKTNQGMLINDGKARYDLGDYNTISAPAQLATGNYAVIAQMQVLDIKHCWNIGFELRAKKNVDKHGFTTGYELGLDNSPYLYFDVNYLPPGSDNQNASRSPFPWKGENYILNANWHIYRIEANKSIVLSFVFLFLKKLTWNKYFCQYEC